MSTSPPPTPISRLVALATLGTLVVSTIACVVIVVRTATYDDDQAAADVESARPRKPATTSSRMLPKHVAEAIPNAFEPRSGLVVPTASTAPAMLDRQAPADAPRTLTFSGSSVPNTPYPTTPYPSTPYPSTSPIRTAMLPTSDQPPQLSSSSPAATVALPTLPDFPTTDEPQLHGPAQAPVAVLPTTSPENEAGPTAVIAQGAPVEVGGMAIQSGPTAAGDLPANESPSIDAPPSPWSRFVAVYGAGHFTAQGTISLADVRAMALRNNKEIAVIGNVPRITSATAGIEEAVFDPVFTINPVGGRFRRQLSTEVQSLSSTSNVLNTGFLLPGSSLNQVYLEKLYRTGGKLQVGVGQNFQQVSPLGNFVLVNPAWQSSVNIIAEQPLFRGRGADWTEAPLRIARANQAQSQQSFQATVNQVLRDAEIAYWDAYAAYQDFEVRRSAAEQALQTVERERGRLRLGEGSVPDVAQAEEQAEAFQIAQAVAENRLIDAQRTLRRVMGIAPDDPRPVIPATAASDAPVVVGWEEAAQQAFGRPEIGAQQAIVQAAEVEVCRRRNGLLPDISVRAIYSVTGLENHWDEAWSTVGTAGFQDWTVGALYRQPLGRRADNSLAQRAAATLSFESAKLRQLEHEILHQLSAACQNVAAAEKLLSMHRRRREAAAIQLEARRELYLENRAQLRDELDAEVRYASAVLDESIARVNYQRALTDWNYARGAIAGGDVVVSE